MSRKVITNLAKDKSDGEKKPGDTRHDFPYV